MWKHLRLAISASCIAFPLCARSADDCSAGSAFSIASQDDATALSKCSEYTGDVVISAATSGNITINGLVTVHGSVTIVAEGSKSNTSVTEISSNTLKTVDNGLTITGLGQLESIVLPSLKTVGGDLKIQQLPELYHLRLDAINSVGSFSLVAVPSLIQATIGSLVLSDSPDVGLKHITSQTNPVVEVRGAGLSELGGIMDSWNASLFVLEDLPNLTQALLLVGHVGEVRISGNGNLTLHMAESTWAGDTQPVIEKLNITGIRHISPCLWPDVWDFIAINNTVEYLHFGFKKVRRLEIRNNEHMKTLVPFNGKNLWEWNLTDILIKDNPLLLLSEYPPRVSEDNLTLSDCPYMFENTIDQWQWYPFHMQTLVVDANIDNTFFSSFVELWRDRTSNDNTVPKVLQDFEISSTNKSFDCSQLDNLRANLGAFPESYSCQGHSLAAGGVSGDASGGIALDPAGASWMSLLGVIMVSAVCYS